MSANGDNVRLWDPQLSDREIYFIGAISVQWASMEHEIFMQTLSTFDLANPEQVTLPKEMNNMQFSGILALWKERVVEKAKGRRAEKLKSQYEGIVKLKSFRDALAHGMWQWSPENVGAIKTVRVKKKEIITTEFSAPSLEDFARKLAEINFWIRFPGGTSDFVRARMRESSYISRRAMAAFTGVPADGDGYPLGNPAGTENDT